MACRLAKVLAFFSLQYLFGVLSLGAFSLPQLTHATIDGEALQKIPDAGGALRCWR